MILNANARNGSSGETIAFSPVGSPFLRLLSLADQLQLVKVSNQQPRQELTEYLCF